VPIVGLTANAFRDDAEACREAGMDGFLAKPVTMDRLSAAIAGVLHLRPATATAAGYDTLAELTATLGAATVAAIVAAFVETLPAQLAEMRGMATAGDADGVLRMAHALTGSAATVGCTELAAAARALLQALAASPVDDLAARLDRIEALARRALDALAPAVRDRAA
jgi:HPt (histidine-containing phosphotransfer) domain-containing protein